MTAPDLIPRAGTRPLLAGSGIVGPVAAAEAHLRNVDLAASREALRNLTKGPVRQ